LTNKRRSTQKPQNPQKKTWLCVFSEFCVECRVGFSVTDLLCLQRSLKELRHRRDFGSPVSPQERIVDIIGQNQALDLHALREEPAFEIDGLVKIHGAIVIAVDQQDR
jgi:hypothetical protein